MHVPEPGELFVSKYRLQGLLGIGGFARVYRAEDGAGRAVAIKILLPDDEDYTPATLGRFQREVKIVGGLRDPHTVTMYESGRSPEGLLYIVFEHVPGRDLSEILETEGGLDASQTIHIMRQVLMSLREAHASGLLHRDIKPENIRVFEYMGDPLNVKVLDFGIAKSPDRDAASSITKTGELVGTPRYMSPEQLMARPLTAASDIYSLGLVMFETLLGRDALQGNAWSDQLERLQSGYVLSVPEIERLGPGLVAVLNRMSARDETQRFATADAVLHALDALGGATTASPRSVKRTSPLIVIGGTLGLVALAALAAAAVLLPRKEPPARSIVAKRALPGILKTSKPASAGRVMPVADVGLHAAPDSAGGCRGAAPFIGFGEVKEPLQTPWVAYVPRSYTPDVQHPVVLVAYPDHIQPDVFIRQTGLDVLADEEGFILVSPNLGEVKLWHELSDSLLLASVFEKSTGVFCVDRKRVFVLGHNNGGRAVESVFCEPWVTAVAYSSHRPRVGQFQCDGGGAKPALLLSPMKTGHLPLDGGINCYGSDKISLADFEQRWRDRDACEGKAKPFFSHSTSDCQTWSCDRAALVTCHLDGGLGWPGTPVRVLADWKGCDGTPADFPSAEVVWRFFDSVSEDPLLPAAPEKPRAVPR